MLLSLHRPISFFDLETTGIKIGHDRIVEISILRLQPDGSKNTKTWRVNPEMPIPDEASQVHGIYDKDIVNEPTFKMIAPDVNHFMQDTDLAGYNSNKFDIPLLVEEFSRAGLVFEMKGRRLVDVQHIFFQMEKRTLEAAYKFYCDKNLTNAHSAEADVTATYEILEAQLNRYSSIQPDVNSLHEFCNSSKNVDLAGRMVYNDKKQEVFNFGKYKGRLVEEIFKTDPGYYDWMMKGDFAQQTKQMLTAIKLKNFGK